MSCVCYAAILCVCGRGEVEGRGDEGGLRGDVRGREWEGRGGDGRRGGEGMGGWEGMGGGEGRGWEEGRGVVGRGRL